MPKKTPEPDLPEDCECCEEGCSCGDCESCEWQPPVPPPRPIPPMEGQASR